MTIKQELFCKIYVKTLNAVKAYKTVYGCLESSARIGSSGLLKNDEIREYIGRLLIGIDISDKKTNVSEKKCIVCGKVFPHTKEYFYSRGGEKLRSECKRCNEKRRKELENSKDKFEISQHKRDIKIQKELWKLSYSIEINEEEYEGMNELTRSFQKVHFYNDGYYAYKPHLMLIKGFFDDHKLNLLIEKIEDKYNTEIYKELNIFSINEPCEYDTGLFVIENKAVDTGFVCLKLYAKNIFSKLTKENQENLSSCYNSYKNYPIQIQVILKPNGKEFQYMDTIEIK